ncbi:MAG: hypothetical protein EXR91_10515 [Gemmatimonadetes bacterium]|nr:hypothetical protein [Gemmatimonadota bacterium]
MNGIERWIYACVKDRPVLKQRIVDVYQAALSLVPQKAIDTSGEPIVREGFFHGFHDKSPFSSDGSRLLAHRSLIGEKRVSLGDAVEVGVFEGREWRDFRSLARTTGWNWQLGAMLQWTGSAGDRIVFNAIDGTRPMAKVVNLEGVVQEEWPHPVVHVSPSGSHACSYDFCRVEDAMPGYGIVSGRGVPGTDLTSSFRVFECASGHTTFALSLEEAAGMSWQPSMDGAFHYFHHALFSPNGRRLFFLHRWLDTNRRRWTRMFSAAPDGSELYLFPMDEMVSHVTWASPSEIFGYMRYPRQGDGYYLVEDRTGEAKRYFREILDSDGHPTMDKKRGIVLTDTYPDRFRNQCLVLCVLDGARRIDLCRTHLPRRFARELQVDLHPRLHPTDLIACFDSGHTGRRSLVTLDFAALG